MNKTGMRQYILEREGCPLHYWLAGPQDGLLVVLTHGATIDHTSWEPQLPANLKMTLCAHGFAVPTTSRIQSMRELARVTGHSRKTMRIPC